MIRDLDDSLEALKGDARTGSELATAPISFAAPDSTWRGQTTTLALNAYLYHVSENRQLRSNEPRVHISNGSVLVESYPARVQCTYLITAWNRASPVGTLEQELQEHRLLSQVLSVLLANPLMPRVYLQGLLANQELDPPVVAAEEDGATTSADFWNSLGTYLRPSITCRITVALQIDQGLSGPMMTTLRLQVEDDGERTLIGGTVANSSAEPVAGAWVRVDETSEEARTDEHGRFVFTSLASGPYTLTVRAAGYEDGGGPILVPSANGLYDMTLVEKP